VCLAHPHEEDELKAEYNRERVLAVAQKIHRLQQLTRDTGFVTKRSQGDLMKPLTAEELVAVYAILQRISNQTTTERATNANNYSHSAR
jgi:hypothetical protein